jgi:hypothetical protein
MVIQIREVLIRRIDRADGRCSLRDPLLNVVAARTGFRTRARGIDRRENS